MMKEKDEIEDILDSLGIPEESNSPIEGEVVVEDENSSKASNALNKSKDKMIKNISDLYKNGDQNTKDKFVKRLQNYDSQAEYDKDLARCEKITPDIEKVLFPYFIAGATVRSIWQQFGSKFAFSLQTLYKARNFYLWEERKKQIQLQVMGEQGADLSNRLGDYSMFFDDLMGEAMIRFKKNSEAGKNSNPYETLKVTNIKDMRDLTEMQLNLMKIKNQERTEKEAKEEGTKKAKISDKKAAQLLSILANDDDDKEEEE